jgi:endoglucanase
MKVLAGLVGMLLLAAVAGPELSAQEASGGPSYNAWWQGGYLRPKKDPRGRTLPLIRVDGNHLVDPEGQTVLFRGLAISDPDKIEKQGHWSREHFEKVKEMGAAIVRIPVHPVAWRERTPRGYLELLDQAVGWSTELGLYAMIDWHSIGNLGMELFQNPMYDTTRRETFEFWRSIARHFAGHNTVAFYELFNEPTVYRGQLGRISWSEWKRINEEIVTVIRGYDTETIPLVAGFDWAYDLTPIRLEPIAAEGIGYVSHPYAHKRPRPWPPRWDENFGFAAERYPVVVTEFGLGLRPGDQVGEDHYGNVLTRYLEEKGISWIGWVFDPEWGPPLLKSWDTYELTPAGAFFKEALSRPPHPPAQ